MRHRSFKSRAGRVALGAVIAGALSGAGASIARANFSLDLEVGSATPNAPVTTASVNSGGTVNVEVYGIVTDPNNSGTANGFGGMFAAFDASSSAASAVSSLGMSLNSPFNYNLGSAASNGTAYGPISDGTNTHVGVGNLSSSSGSPIAYDSTNPNGWVFAAYLNDDGTNVGSIFNGGTAITSGPNAGGAYFDLGTLTFTAGAGNGTVDLGGTGREQVNDSMVAALWTENGTVEQPATGTSFGVSGVTITVGTGGGGTGTHYIGDTSPYNGAVGLDDLNNVLNNYGTHNAAGYAWPNSATNTTNAVGLSDLNNVLNNYGQQNSSTGPAFAMAVPEPASLGMLSVVSLAAIRRRRK